MYYISIHMSVLSWFNILVVISWPGPIGYNWLAPSKLLLIRVFLGTYLSAVDIVDFDIYNRNYLL